MSDSKKGGLAMKSSNAQLASMKATALNLHKGKGKEPAASNTLDMSSKMQRMARQQRRRVQDPPPISLSWGVIKGLQSECNAPLPLDKAAAERHFSVETSALFFAGGTSSPLEKEDAGAMAVREREATEAWRREKREREEIFADRLKHRVALLQRTLRSAAVEAIPPVKPRRVWTVKQGMGDAGAKDELGTLREEDPSLGPAEDSHAPAGREVQPVVIRHVAEARGLSASGVALRAGVLSADAGEPGRPTGMREIVLQAQASSLRARALLDGHQQRFGSATSATSGSGMPAGDPALAGQILHTAAPLPQGQVAVGAGGNVTGHVTGHVKESEVEEGIDRRISFLNPSEAPRRDTAATDRAHDRIWPRPAGDSSEAAILRDEREAVKEELARGVKEGVRVGPMGVLLLRKRDEYEARGQGSQYFADVWKCAMEAERGRIQWMRSQQQAALHQQKIREKREEAKAEEIAVSLRHLAVPEEIPAAPTPAITLALQKQREEEARDVERREKRERMQQLHRSLEHSRYTDARHATMVERVERTGVEVPPLCACGHGVSPLQPSYVFACANNCPLYRDVAEYQRILYATLHALGLAT